MDSSDPRNAQALPTEQGAARRVRPSDEDLLHIRAAWAEAAAGQGVEVTPEELTEWERTGELLASVQARVAGRA